MKNVFVIGAGTMGLDIAQVFATAGYNVTAYGRTDASIGKSSAKLTKSLTKRVDRGKMTQRQRMRFLHTSPLLPTTRTSKPQIS